MWKLEGKHEKEGGRGTSQENGRDISRVEERDWEKEKGMERRNTGEPYLPNYLLYHVQMCTNESHRYV